MTVSAAGVALLVALSTAGSEVQASKAAETFDAAWRTVRDTHFDVEMNGVDWEAVRVALRPRALAAANDGELREVIRDMLGRLGQSHFAIIPAGADSAQQPFSDLSGAPGFDIRPVGEQLLVTRVDPAGGAALAGVRTGWALAAVDSTDVAQLLASVPGGLPERLRHVEIWRRLETRLRGPQGSTIVLTFIGEADRRTDVEITRRGERGHLARVGNLPAMPVQVDVHEHRTPAGRVAGLIRFNVWMPAVDAAFQDAVDRQRSADGILIDLRGNPGGLAAMLMGISGHFLAERKPLGVMKTRDNELKFIANPRLVNAAGARVSPYAGPVAILVDALTGSASECFAGGMQAIGRARVFGQTSMGQALPALFTRLPNGDVLIHALGDFVTADGTRLEGRGVVPDEAVPLRREELLAGRDVVLERALAWIDGAR